MTPTDPRDMSQGEAAFYKLMEAIEAGIYRPGDRLRETEVADRLALSRTPIREAMRRLEAENIVEHRPPHWRSDPHIGTAGGGRAL